MANVHPFRAVYKVVDEHEIDVDIYLPPLGKPSKDVKHPVIIDIHGGAFMLGCSKMVNRDQIDDCLSRGWIVLAPNHRLCPQVNLLEGPMKDCRDLLMWIYQGGLHASIASYVKIPFPIDLDHVFAFGTSSGGTLALCLGFGVPRKVAGIFVMYAPCHFAHPFWTTRLPDVALRLPAGLSEEFINRVFDDDPVPITGGVSLEGQQQGAPNIDDPRQAFALTQIANGRVMDVIFPSKKWTQVDPIENIMSSFPPTFLVHGTEDKMVPVQLSRHLYKALCQQGINCGLKEITGEGHTFAAKMTIGSSTWNLQQDGFNFLESLIH